MTEETIKIDKLVQIKIIHTKDGKELNYIVLEPELTEKEKSVLDEVKKILIEKIEYDYATVAKTENPEDYLTKKLQEAIREKSKSIRRELFEKIKYHVIRDFIGLGKIDAIMKDANIEDVYCNGVNIPVFVRHRKYGSLKTNIIFTDMDELEKFVMVLSQKSRRFVTYAEPLLDATLPDGSRLQASFGQDVTLKGPTFSIRKFQKLPLTPIELIKFGTASPAMMAYFWLAIENNVTILIAGGSGTGKTSFLNAISMFIPPDYKIISIEDTSEINLPHKNWVKAVTRAGYGPKVGRTRYGEVTMFDLLKTSLRQRPDYVIVGEVRGEEASVLFQGMASGHASLGTIHAESLEAVIERLTTPPINLPPNLIELVDVVVLEILATAKGPNARRISKVIEIKNVTRERPDIKTPFLWDPYNDTFMPIETFLRSGGLPYESFLVEKLSLKTGKTKEELLQELRKKERIINWMVENDIKSFHEVYDIISNYRYSPESVLEKIKEKEIRPIKKEVKLKAKPKKIVAKPKKLKRR